MLHFANASFSMTAAFVIASTLLSFRAIARKPVWMLHFANASFSMTAAFVIASTLLSFRAIARKPVWMLHFANASFSMTAAFVIASTLLSFRAIARKPVWMLHFANASFSMTRWCIPSIPFVVIPSASEESIMDASLRCAVQHDKVVHSKHSLCCHSER
jgi:uncharacterized membrane protein